MSLITQITKDLYYPIFKENWINYECRVLGKHFVIPDTFECSLCHKQAIKLKNGGYKF
jgi:hypothetical protein